MRFLFLLTVAINIGLFAYGQGLFGTPPADRGRAGPAIQQVNQAAVKLGAPSSQTTTL